MIRIHFPGLDENPNRQVVLLADAARRQPTHPHESRPYSERLRGVFDDHFLVSSAEQADVFVFPFDYRDSEEAQRAAAGAQTRNLPCVFFLEDEEAPPARPPYGVVYRHSIFKREQGPRERSMPSWHPDVYDELGFPLLDRPAEPTVGFCGFVGTRFSRSIYRLLLQFRKADGLSLRHTAIKCLRDSPELRENVVLRRGYWGDASLAGVSSEYGNLMDIRLEYLMSIRDNAYTLAIRGKGNHSVRFFETLSAGRIPLFVNTQCVLPLEDEVNYRDHCVWVELSELDHIGEITEAFHRTLDSEAFLRLQQQNRRLWRYRLSPESFFPHILQKVVAGDISM